MEKFQYSLLKYANYHKVPLRQINQMISVDNRKQIWDLTKFDIKNNLYFNLWVFASILSLLIVWYIFLTSWAEGMEVKFKGADPISSKKIEYKILASVQQVFFIIFHLLNQLCYRHVLAWIYSNSKYIPKFARRDGEDVAQ